MATILPKEFVYKKVKYYLIDRQYSKSNAQLSLEIYSKRALDAKYLIRHDTLNGKDIYGIYTSRKIIIRRK
jgi:hypothetical protein